MEVSTIKDFLRSSNEINNFMACKHVTHCLGDDWSRKSKTSAVGVG